MEPVVSTQLSNGKLCSARSFCAQRWEENGAGPAGRCCWMSWDSGMQAEGCGGVCCHPHDCHRASSRESPTFVALECVGAQVCWAQSDLLPAALRMPGEIWSPCLLRLRVAFRSGPLWGWGPYLPSLLYRATHSRLIRGYSPLLPQLSLSLPSPAVSLCMAGGSLWGEGITLPGPAIIHTQAWWAM